MCSTTASIEVLVLFGAVGGAALLLFGGAIGDSARAWPAQVALDRFTASVAGLPSAEAQRAIATFGAVLTAVGTPDFNQIASAVNTADMQPYRDAYTAGIRAALGLGGAIAVVAA